MAVTRQSLLEWLEAAHGLWLGLPVGRAGEMFSDAVQSSTSFRGQAEGRADVRDALRTDFAGLELGCRGFSNRVARTTCATLRTDGRAEKVSRMRQIVDWLGSDFDGVIVFDEAHAMQNAAGGRGERGDVAASQQGRAGLRLQHALPEARVLYVSATGATTVQNLAYAQRLGLWGGADFPFATRAGFVEAVEAGGVAAMEVLARDLRALGLYTARSPSTGSPTSMR